ncbi:MAG: hypothetical protein HC795_10535 [Coleofasciculaceae cyanobacterium RL_1_1]|nr:hypothetical protein [Coleofasciculaceae cyanobacterium RL_1_1]
MLKPTVPAFLISLVLSVLSGVPLDSLTLDLTRGNARTATDRVATDRAALTQANPANPAPAYDQGIQAAHTAWQATGTAKVSRDWQAVAQWWARAAYAMQSVPTDDPRWILAQKKTREYLAGAAYAFERAEASASDRVAWTFGSDVIDEKLALYTAHVAAEGVPEIAIVGSSRALQGIDPTALQQELEQRGQRSVRSLNLGINGATAQVVDRFVREVLPSDQLPRRIIWADGVRAFNSGRPDRTDSSLRESPGYRALKRGDLTIQPNDIDGSSAIRADGFLAIETRFQFDRYYRDRSPVAGQYDGDYANFSLAGEQGEATQRLLDFTQAQGIELILVPLPLTTGYLDPIRMAGEREFRQLLARLAQQYRHVTLMDLDPTLPDRYFQDPSHLNRYGAVEVSREIARQLRF